MANATRRFAPQCAEKNIRLWFQKRGIMRYQWFKRGGIISIRNIFILFEIFEISILSLFINLLGVLPPKVIVRIHPGLTSACRKAISSRRTGNGTDHLVTGLVQGKIYRKPKKKNMVSYLNQSNEFSHLRWYHQANSCLVAIGQEGLIDVPVEQAAETQGVDLRNGLPLPILKGLVSAVSPFWNPLSANQHWKKYNMCSNHQLFEQHLIFNKPCEFWGQTNGK